MDQDVQSRVEELEQNVQAKDRELAQSQQELRQKVYRNTEVFSRTFISHYVHMYHNVGRRYIGMARMPASRNTFSKPPNSQTKKL